jgi:cellulose synthase/poly-beta-1,6-N-acetylglucosamine synthase-like glycosyltransferase
MGTGMAFPWELIRTAPLASGHLVEDMQLGLDLAATGSAPLFCPEAGVTSSFPSSAEGIATQRARWERGHVSVIAREGPRAMWRAITRGRLSVVAMVLDLCVPPLAMLVLLLVLQFVVDLLLFGFWGLRAPLLLAFAALAMMAVAVGLGWSRFGRHIISGMELASVPLYVLGKLPLYARFFKSGTPGWVRTQRDTRDK